MCAVGIKAKRMPVIIGADYIHNSTSVDEVIDIINLYTWPVM